MTSIVVTGAAGGIGEAIALGAASRGWSVAALDVDPAVRAVADAATAAGAPAALGIECDVAAEADVADAIDRAVRELGPIDGVVANAGIEITGRLDDLPLERWQRVIDVNLTGVYLTMKHALRVLLEQKTGGSIVCTSSPSAFVGFAGGGNGAYGASKGGVSALVRSAALDYAADGIRINALVPGATDTSMLRSSDGETSLAAIARAASRQIPMGRLARPSEIAAAALWLLSDESSYVTGSNLVVDGGLLAKSANTI